MVKVKYEKEDLVEAAEDAQYTLTHLVCVLENLNPERGLYEKIRKILEVEGGIITNWRDLGIAQLIINRILRGI